MRILRLLVLSAAFAVHTGANSPPGKARNFRCSPHSGKRLEVYFYGAPEADVHLITARHSTEGYTNGKIITSTSSYIRLLLEIGKCGRNYNVTVLGMNSYGYGPALSQTCKTELRAPTISSHGKMGLYATIRWTNDCDTRHDVLIVDQNDVPQRYNDSQSPYTFTMAANMLYYTQVIAVYEVGERRSSKTYFNTGWPGFITSVTHTSTSHSIHMQWQKAEYANSYHIEITSNSNNTVLAKLDTKDNEFQLLNNVKAGRRYNFEVRGSNKFGQGHSYSSYLYSASDFPIIQSASLSNGTAKIEWSGANDNENYLLSIYTLTGSRIYSGVVNDITYSWNLTTATSNFYAVMETRDYESNRQSNRFYFSNDASRPVINEVSQTSLSHFLIDASTFKAFTYYTIRVDSYYNDDGIVKYSSRNTQGRRRKPFWANIYHNSGKLYTDYITIFFDGTASDTVIYKTEPPQTKPTLTQSPLRTDSVLVAWTQVGYVERFHVFAALSGTGSDTVNVSTTSNRYRINGLKAGHYYNVTVTPENPAGRGPSCTLLVKTEMAVPSVTGVTQQFGYLAHIEWSPARDALRHIIIITSNDTSDAVNLTGRNPVFYPLNGSLELNIQLLAVYGVGNSSSTFSFQGCCENSTCGSNSSCHLDENNNQICSCPNNFKGDATVACYPFCPTKQLGSYTFEQSPVGKLVYASKTCPSGRPTASATCEIRKVGGKYYPQFRYYTTYAADCFLQMINVTYEANELTSRKLKKLCEQFQVLTANLSLIENDDVIELIKFYAIFDRSYITISTNGMRACLTTASQLTGYFRSHHSKKHELALLKALPKMLRNFEKSRYASYALQQFTWTSENVFAKVIDVPIRVARNSENETLTINSEFISSDGTGKPVLPIEFIVPFNLVSSVHESLTQCAEPGLQTVRIVFLAFRDTTLFPTSHKSDLISFLEIGGDKHVIRTNLSEALMFRQQESSEGNLHCGRLNLQEFYWTGVGCTSNPETKSCSCYETGYYGIFQKVLGPHIRYRVQHQDVAGCTAVIVAYIYTIFSIAIKRTVWSHKILAFLQMLGALSACHLLFITGVDQTASFVSCAVVASLLHYFLLCTWTWSSIYVYTMYRNDVQGTKEIDHKLAKTGTIFAYCIPLVVAAIAGGAVWPETASYDESPISSRLEMCFLQSFALYFGLILPVGVLAVWIFYAYISSWKNIGKNGGQRTEILWSSVFVLTFLLSWTAAVSAIFTSNVIASWIFFALNLFQAIRLSFGTRYTVNEDPPARLPGANDAYTGNQVTENQEYETTCAGMAAENPVEHRYEDVRMYENMSQARY